MLDLSKITDKVLEISDSMPSPVKKNILKAMNHLGASLLEVPSAWLSNYTSEKKAISDARNTIVKAIGDKISVQLDISPEYQRIAEQHFTSKIVKQQLTLDEISVGARIEVGSILKTEPDNKKDGDATIETDWLNYFEGIAKIRSTDEMKHVLSKILAGEIVNPGSYSLRTLRIVSELDKNTSQLFKKLASIATCLRFGRNIIDCRVIAVNGDPNNNSLRRFGLDYNSLNILEENGLIIPSYNSYFDYRATVKDKNGNRGMAIELCSKKFGLISTNESNFQRGNMLPIEGVALSNSGKELFQAIEPSFNDLYISELTSFFRKQNFILEYL
jgi:hypothetical protein